MKIVIDGQEVELASGGNEEGGLERFSEIAIREEIW